MTNKEIKQLIKDTNHVAEAREREYKRQAEQDDKYGYDELDDKSTERGLKFLTELLKLYKGDYK